MSFQKVMENLMKQAYGINVPVLINSTRPNKPGVEFFTAGNVPMQPPVYYTPLIVPSTATEQEQKDWGDIKEMEAEIIFELDGWQIESYVNSPANDLDWISHYCPVEKWRYRIDQWEVMGTGVCPACTTEIPEDVMGVWKLKNFDHLPSIADIGVVNYNNILPTSNSKPEDVWA